MEKTVNGHTFEEIKIPMPFGHISAIWWGPQEKQPIIAIHGWQDNAGTFEPLIQLLPNDYSILCIDLPGHGHSSHFPEGISYQIQNFPIILRRIVNYYNWKKISIMGHSLGAYGGFLYAAIYPNEVEMLITFDAITLPLFLMSDFDHIKKYGLHIDKFLKLDANLSNSNKTLSFCYSDMIDIAMTGYGTLTRKSCEILMKRGLQRLNKKFIFSRDERLKIPLFLSSDVDPLQLASQIKCRFMNIKAMPIKPRDNWSVYLKVLDIIKRNAKEFVYKEYNDNHFLHLNNPEYIVSDVKNFIEQTIPVN